MSSPGPSAVVVLAAGEGTRMKSATPKVLHAIGGRSLLAHAMVAARAVDPADLVVVVRHGRDLVAAHAQRVDPTVIVADQDDVPGTGRALACGLAALGDAAGAGARGPGTAQGTILVTYGDVPLLRPATLRQLGATHAACGAAVTVVTAHLPDPTGYGRIVRDSSGVARIVEQKDASADELAITEVNSGIYALDATWLATALPRLGRSNAQGEMYLTDVIALARADDLVVASHVVVDTSEVAGVNDRLQLAELGAELNRRLLADAMRAGTTVVDPTRTWIDVGVRLERDTTLLPGTALHGSTTIAEGAVIGPDTSLTDVAVGRGASVVRTHAVGAEIGPGATVGPFSYLRPGTRLAAGVHVGAFVETKNAVVGSGSKVPHLSYVGDAEIGEGANIGAATIFANYDGLTKSRTVVGDHAFVGSDSVLVAPVTIGDGAYTAAGSVITESVPPGAIGVARGRQKSIRGWVQRRRPGTASAAAAAAAENAAAGSESADQQRSEPREGQS